MNHGSLFSGIGGFDLASEWMGWNNLFHCEWNQFCQQVLKYYWSNAKSYDDITKTDFSIWRGRIDILTGGFPCQPYSVAGKRKGKDDERHLWPEMLRAIQEIKPTWVVGENVSGIVNWNAGLVFEEVQTDLEAEGYEVQTFILPAAGVNAPHKRYRVWFVAYSANAGVEKMCEQEVKTNRFKYVANASSDRLERFGFNRICKSKKQSEFKGSFCSWIVTNTGYQRCYNGSDYRKKRYFQSYQRFTKKNKPEWKRRKCGLGEAGTITTYADSRRQSRKKYRKTKPGFFTKKSVPDNWGNFPTQSPICNGNDGVSTRLDGITFPKWKNESIKAGGNAIVPQVVLQIFKAIQEYEHTHILRNNTCKR